LTAAVEEVRGEGEGRWTGNGLTVAPLGCVWWTGPRGRKNVRKTRREQTDAVGGANLEL
jgi:hypothetical protein